MFLLDTVANPFPQKRSVARFVVLLVRAGAGMTTKSVVQLVPNISAFMVPMVASPTLI